MTAGAPHAPALLPPEDKSGGIEMHFELGMQQLQFCEKVSKNLSLAARSIIASCMKVDSKTEEFGDIFEVRLSKILFSSCK